MNYLHTLLVVSVLCVLPLSCTKEGPKDPTLPGVVKPSEDVPTADDLIYATRQIPQPTMKDAVVEHFIAPDAPFDYDVRFVPDATDFPNPERGAYANVSYSFINGTIPAVRSAEEIRGFRKNNTTLCFTFFYLNDYVNKADLAPEVLETMRKHFDNLRKSGCKAVLRLAYSWHHVNDPALEEPQEPTADIIVEHIRQIKPILQEYADVIAIMQAGFIGTYGEWAYTTHVKTPEDHAKVVRALLDALPANRQLAIRTPGWKYRLLKLLTGSEKDITERDSITVETGFGTSDKARLAIHNDCAFVNGNDGGTFGNVYDRQYVRTESDYTLYGGESCYQNHDEFCTCLPSYVNLKNYHWSYLSNHYAIADIWRKEGCYNDATSRVGYRFILNGAKFFGNFASDEDFAISLCLSNYGFASLINERKVEFVLVNTKNAKEKYTYVSKQDPRVWKGGHAYVLTERIVLPGALQVGAEYNLYINLPDVSPNLHDIPDYSIRFANKNIWDASTGYNLLGTFKVEE